MALMCVRDGVVEEPFPITRRRVQETLVPLQGGLDKRLPSGVRRYQAVRLASDATPEWRASGCEYLPLVEHTPGEKEAERCLEGRWRERLPSRVRRFQAVPVPGYALISRDTASLLHEELCRYRPDDERAATGLLTRELSEIDAEDLDHAWDR